MISKYIRRGWVACTDGCFSLVFFDTMFNLNTSLLAAAAKFSKKKKKILVNAWTLVFMTRHWFNWLWYAWSWPSESGFNLKWTIAWYNTTTHFICQLNQKKVHITLSVRLSILPQGCGSCGEVLRLNPRPLRAGCGFY
jgi:hypothetical protein